MNYCQSSGNTGCSSTDQSDSSGGSRLGTWIGTAIGVWIALLIIVWFLRTFINKTRRKRFLRKVCIRKQTTGRQHPPAKSSKSTRRSADEVIYYTPTLPPSYSETMRRPAQFYLPSSPDSETMRRPAQFYLPSSPDRIQERQPQFYLSSSPGGFPCFPGHIQFCIPCSAFLPSRLKKYRGSLSTLSHQSTTHRGRCGGLRADHTNIKYT
ncbi:hypothetical protein Btru_042619 [Bulinus truncatus]|nr:hypothetical protein Btru_042619 [Bulinus truncatus]